MLIVVMVIVRVLVLASMAIVMVVVVVRLMGMRVAMVALHAVVVFADGVVKRHVDGRQDFETGQPEQAGQHGANTHLSRSSKALHSSGR